MRAGLMLALLLVLSSSPAAAVDDELVLKPSSAWNLRYDEDKCRMLRSFGEGDQSVTLMFDQSGVEPYYTISLFGSPIDTTYGRSMRVKFGDEPPTERSYLKGQLEDKTPLVAMYGVNLAPILPLESDQDTSEVEPIGESREAAIERIVFSGGLDVPLILETGSLGEPLAAMRRCAIDLVGYLGIGEESSQRFSQRAQPKNNPGNWVTTNDYPSGMLRRREEGVVRFRLTIDSNGRPTSCHITRSTRPQTFDDTVCIALLKRATFEPALDSEAKPVASYWHSAVRFEMPR